MNIVEAIEHLRQNLPETPLRDFDLLVINIDDALVFSRFFRKQGFELVRQFDSSIWQVRHRENMKILGFISLDITRSVERGTFRHYKKASLFFRTDRPIFTRESAQPIQTGWRFIRW